MDHTTSCSKLVSKLGFCILFKLYWDKPSIARYEPTITDVRAKGLFTKLDNNRITGVPLVWKQLALGSWVSVLHCKVALFGVIPPFKYIDPTWGSNYNFGGREPLGIHFFYLHWLTVCELNW